MIKYVTTNLPKFDKQLELPKKEAIKNDKGLPNSSVRYKNSFD